MREERGNAMVITYKCPNCGGGLQFDPSTQKYKCEFCFSLFTQKELEELQKEDETEKLDHEELDQTVDTTVRMDDINQSDKVEEEAEERQTETVLYECPSCGAQIVTDETTAATFCYYCHNPVVLSGRVSGDFRPDQVVPFEIDRKKAETIFTEWIQKKRFVPDDFFSKKQIETFSGIYFPFWLYDCKVNGRMSAEGVRIRVWRSGDREYTETKRYDVSRSGKMEIKHVAKNALKKADKDLVEGILPFDLEHAKPFSTGFLTGFGAEKRDMGQSDFKEMLQNEIREYAQADMKAQASAGYNRVRVLDQSMEIEDEHWSYVLLPVWLMTYQDKKKDRVYFFALNGQSGKVCGELPVDYKKIAVMFFSIFLPLLILFLIGGYLI